MKSFTFNFLSLLLCLLMSISIHAQDEDDGPQPSEEDKPPIVRLGTIHNDGDGSDPIDHFCLDENNSFSFSTEVILSNLDLFEDEDGAMFGTVWEDVEPMYVEFKINGVTYPPQPLGVFDAFELEDGTTFFSYEVQSPTVDFSNDCAAPKKEGDDQVWINAIVRLVTPVGDGYEIYPACQYVNGEYDMFSCNIYYSAPWCQSTSSIAGSSFDDDVPTTCYDEWYRGIIQAYGHCDCGLEDPDPGPDPDQTIKDGKLIGDEEDITKRSVSNDELNVYPNPMQNVLTLASESDYITNVEIYDARGNAILFDNYGEQGIGKVNLDTAILPKGLYLARVTTISGIKVVKVLK